MSGEVAQPTSEATVPTDLPSSHHQPAATDGRDASASAASPGASIFVSSTSTTAPASTTLPTSELFPTDPAGQKPKDNIELGPEAGITAQSISPADFQPTQADTKQTGVQEKSSTRGSRSSIKVPSRRGSAASSKLSKKDRNVVPAASSHEKSLDEEPSQAAAKPKKKAISRIFSILNCCSAPKDANELELDQAVPTKKVRTLQSNRGRQTAPMTRLEPGAGESSNTESKEPIEDNIAGPPYSELTPAAKPRIIEPPPKKPPTMDNVPPPNDQDASLEQKPVPGQPTSSDQPLPPLPPTLTTSDNDDKDIAMPNAQEAISEKPSATGTDGLVEPPAPPPPSTAVAQGISKEEVTINDRTPQQEARDVEMPDAPPVPPAPEPQTTKQEPAVQSPPQSNLPPPPPIVSPNRPPVADRQTSNGATTTEQQKWLLPPIDARFRGKKCLVLDLDETLVHSSFKILHQADFTIPVEIEGQYHNVYVIKRPGVDQFMKRVGELYEVVVFTASVAKYGDPLLDQLDIHNVVHHRLFRESCYNHQGNYVKDLSQVGRDLRETIIIDNSPTSYIFHPQHAVPISSWFSDAHDNELLDLIPVLEDLAGPQVRDVSLVLDVGL
ncbi:MAG: hypothetical protein Q9201_002831 [Fulgogasparrea decipioides]